MRLTCASGLIWLLLMALVSCTQAENRNDEAADSPALPTLEALAAGEGPVHVVATTSIIGDVVGVVGGDAITLTTLMGPGQDPHNYQPAPSALTEVSAADVIFVNGFGLEEGLLDDLRAIAAGTPVVPISAGIVPRGSDAGDEDNEHALESAGGNHNGSPDPHVWLDPHNVVTWVNNAEKVLSALDPTNASVYESNAAAYRERLKALIADVDDKLKQLPPARRKLVTNHDALSYFADRYDFAVIGTVIPSSSTVAEPSASALAELVSTMAAENVCVVFSESTVSAEIAQSIAADIDRCPEVKVLSLYTGALGPPGSGANSYLDMMRYNIDTIASALTSGP